MPTPIYHITHIDNLTPILNSGGLMANSSYDESELTILILLMRASKIGNKLKLQEKGLMYDLLTGQLRLNSK
jgi:hypothetical protein